MRAREIHKNIRNLGTITKRQCNERRGPLGPGQ